MGCKEFIGASGQVRRGYLKEEKYRKGGEIKEQMAER